MAWYFHTELAAWTAAQLTAVIASYLTVTALIFCYFLVEE